MDNLLLFGLEIVLIEVLKYELSKAFNMKNLDSYIYYLDIYIICSDAKE